MRKYAFALVGGSAVFGMAAFFLRRWELQQLYQDETGLAARGIPSTTVLFAVTAMAVAVALLFGVCTARRFVSVPRYDGTFGMESPAGLLPYALFGAVAVVAAVQHWRQAGSAGNAVETCFFIFAALSGLSVIGSAVSAYTKKRGLLTLTSVVPAVFFCFWLVLIYKQHDTNPQLVEYAFMCLAAAALSLSFYYTAGYAYGKQAPGKLVFSHVLAVYFAVLTLADDWNGAEKLLLLAFACITLINLYLFVWHLVPKASLKEDKE